MNSLTQRDCYALMNEIVSQATGRTDLKVVDTSTFTAVGELTLRTGTENVLNAISTVISKTIFNIRPYKGKLDSLRVAQERWGAQMRKVCYLYSEAEASEDNNVIGSPNNLEDGKSVDMFKIRKPKAIQLNFYGTQVLQKHITRFRDQLSIAFSNEAEFQQFIDGVMIEFYNEIELINEGKARLTLINYMAGLSAMNLTEVDLVAGYNAEYGTTYKREELLSTHLTTFMQYVASTIKTYSSYLTDMTSEYHANIANQDVFMKFTPKEKQKMIMYEPVFIKSQATVYSQLFNPNYLDIGEFEGVNFWQSKKTPTAIKAKPNILDVSNGQSKTAEEIEIPYVLGVLFDTEACGVMPQFDYASTTPFNSAGGYYNMYMHWRFNSFCDFTENGILFTLGAGGVNPEA